MLRSEPALSFIRSIAPGSSSGSIRVRALDTVPSVREQTTFSAACQIAANSRATAGRSPRGSTVSQDTIVWYIRRPYRWVPTGRSRSLTNANTSASGSPQSNVPCLSSMHPSSDAIAE